MSKEIQEGNRLIAEFDELEFIHEGHIPHWSRNNIPEIELQYHSSWDWLMPVVEKIESMWLVVQITTRYCSIIWLGTVDEKYPWLERFEDIHIEPQEWQQNKKETVWKSVIQFIQWYNTQKQ